MNHPYPKTLEELKVKLEAGWRPRKIWRIPLEINGYAFTVEAIMHPEVPKNERARVRSRLYMWEHPGDSTYRAWKTQLKKYGMTEEDYWELYKRQGGVCAICKQKSRRDKLDIDHDHNLKIGDPGFIRGLLCNSCNIGVGCFKNNPDNLKAAVEYLWQATQKLN